MHRLLFCSLFAASLATIAPAAPVPTHLMPKAVSLTIPTKVGTTWVYAFVGIEKTLVITHCESVPGGKGKLVTTKWVAANGERTPHMVMQVNTDGLFLVSEPRNNFAPQGFVLKLPHREGQTWETKVGVFREDARPIAIWTAGPVERVRVPAGEFDAVRVEWEYTVGAETIKTKCWYADGIGPIKMDKYEQLQSFKLPKDEIPNLREQRRNDFVAELVATSPTDERFSNHLVE